MPHYREKQNLKSKQNKIDCQQINYNHGLYSDFNDDWIYLL